MNKQRKPRSKPATPDLEVLRHVELVSVSHFPLIEPAFTAPSLRWHLFHRDTNGLLESGAVVQLGGRLLLRPKQFRAWLETRNASVSA
jgi:hypothetical protein